MGKNYYGIDLGTTYSTIAKIDQDGKPVILKNKEGSTITPSVVNVLDNGNYVVGDIAKNDTMAGGVVIEEVKKNIGSKDFIYETPAGQMNPITISSLILQKLKDDVEEQGHVIDGVTITCPAYFGTVQKHNTKAAGEAIGLNVLNVINEPTAAAYAYIENINEGETKNILVYDLGGGTFDVTLMTIKAYRDEQGVLKREIDVLDTGGDAALGGKDFDKALINMIIERAAANLNITVQDLVFDQITYRDIVTRAEETKKNLTSRDSFIVNIQAEVGRTRVTITREEFELATQPLINKTLELTNQIIDKANNKGLKIDTLLLVGGSTRMPMVRTLLENFQPLKDVMNSLDIISHEPDEAVAKGAALWADLMGEELDKYNEHVNNNNASEEDKKSVEEEMARLAASKSIIINDIITKSYGVIARDQKTNERQISNIIMRGASLDSITGFTAKRSFGPTRDNQESVAVRVMETNTDQENIALEAGTEIYDFDFILPPGAPGTTKIEVTYRFDTSGILHISVTEDYANTVMDSQSVQVTGAYSVEDIDEAKSIISSLVREDD